MRLSNLETLRIVSILLILSMHIYSQIPKEDMIFENLLLGQLINAIGNIGVTCFVLISGYFGIKFKSFRFIQLILITTFYSLFIYLINNGFYLKTEIIDAILIIPRYKNWFITCYLFLMLFSPFINEYLDSISQTHFKKLLLIQFATYSIFPTLFNTPYYTILTGGGKCLLYLIFIYMIGKYMRKYHNNNIKRWKTTSIFLVMTVTICLLNIMLSNILGKQSYIFSLDCSPLILISAISVFYLFKSFTFQKKWINYISSSVLAVYLLDGIRIAISEHITHLEQYSSNPYLIICLCATISITFICSITIDKLRIAILGSAETKLIQIIQTQCKKVNYFINNHFNKL